MSSFALNKPVVATNVGALPTMVKDGQYGTIVPPKDVSALATAIEALIESPQRVDAMMTNIERDYSDGDCSWSAIAQGIIDVYVDKLSAADK